VRRQEAEKYARTAVARLLASEAQEVASNYPQRALLLATEAVKRPLDAGRRSTRRSGDPAPRSDCLDPVDFL